MVHVRSGRNAVMVALMASLLAAQAVSAVADQDGVREKFPKAPVALECPETPPTYCFNPSPGNEAAVRIKVAKRALPIDRVCFTLRFEGDLLDAGEDVSIKLSSDPLAGAFGFRNVGTSPTAERTVCLVAGDHDEFLAMLMVKKPTVYVFMFTGSATLSDLEVSLLRG